MNAFHQALEEGYSPEEVIKYISKAIPQIADPIRKASKAGYNIKQILGYLSKSFDTEDRRGMSETERHAANRRSDAMMVKHGLQIAGAAVAAPIAASVARSALSRALPTNLKNLSAELTGFGAQNPDLSQGQVPSDEMNPLRTKQQQPQVLGQQRNISQQPPVNQVTTNIAQDQSLTQPEVNPILSENEQKRIEALKIFNERSKKKTLADRETERFENEYGKAEDVAKEIIEPEKPKIEKSSFIASPKGFGEVREIRNGQAIIDVDGKLHKVDEDELIQSPLPQKDMADLYEDLIGGIEKTTGQQVSRNVEWAGYDPKTNELAYKPHGSDKLYAYDEISSEDIEVLTGLLTQRKSTGENFIGAWEAGTKSPIGAAMYQLIKKLQEQRGGKGNEYKNRYETIYDAIEPAKLAAKQRYAERKKKAKKPRFD